MDSWIPRSILMINTIIIIIITLCFDSDDFVCLLWTESKYFVYSHDIDSHKIHTQSKILHRILHSQVSPILKPANWQWIGNELAMNWQWVGNELAMNWQWVGSTYTSITSPKSPHITLAHPKSWFYHFYQTQGFLAWSIGPRGLSKSDWLTPRPLSRLNWCDSGWGS